MIKPFHDSTAVIRDGAALAANLDRDGYVFLRGVLPREERSQEHTLNSSHT